MSAELIPIPLGPPLLVSTAAFTNFHHAPEYFLTPTLGDHLTSHFTEARGHPKEMFWHPFLAWDPFFLFLPWHRARGIPLSWVLDPLPDASLGASPHQPPFLLISSPSSPLASSQIPSWAMKQAQFFPAIKSKFSHLHASLLLSKPSPLPRRLIYWKSEIKWSSLFLSSTFSIWLLPSPICWQFCHGPLAAKLRNSFSPPLKGPLAKCGPYHGPLPSLKTQFLGSWVIW